MAVYQFTDFYTFNANGIVMPDTDELKSRVEDMMRTVFGSDIDVTAETPMGRIVEMITLLMVQTLGINAQNANQYNLNQTIGAYLDGVGVLYGLTRKAATHTRVKCTVYGTANTVVPTTVVVQSAEGYKFSPENAITIDNTGSAVGYFLALESGPIPCEHGTLTEIVSGVVGLESVSNNTTTATVFGTTLETDAAYRGRILASCALGSASIRAISNAIYNADDSVSSCVVLENGYSQSIVKRGITIPAHSIFICVFGGDDEAIANAVFNTKTAGAGYTYSAGTATLKNITVTDDVTGDSYHVYFFRPIEVSISASLTVDPHDYSGIDIVGDIRKHIANYLNEVGIGATITKSAVWKYVLDNMQTIDIRQLEISKTGRTAQESITLEANKIATTGDDLITVSLV